MGLKDKELIEYLGDSVRFADLMNGTVFQGKQIVKPKYLQKEPRKKRVLLEVHDQESAQEKPEYMERERDILMLYNEPKRNFYLACEGQSSPDYEMPVRCFAYDAIEYSNQVKKPRNPKKSGQEGLGVQPPLLPVFHQVLYLGEKRWLSKHTLQEMMCISEDIQEYTKELVDYKIHIVDIHEQNPELFHTEWKDIFQLMQNSRKKEKLRAYMEEHKEQIKTLSRETRRFLSILLEQYEIMEDGKVEVKDMCEAWDGAMMMYRDEGIQDGIQQTMKRIVQNMIGRNMSDSEIRALAECSQELIDDVRKETL